MRQQAVLTLGWLCLSREVEALASILFSEWDEEVRRSILTVLFMMKPREEVKLLSAALRDDAPKVSRMANYLISLREDSTLAQAALKQFNEPNEVFFSDARCKLRQRER